MIRLENTTSHAVASAIARERHRMGSPATGMVLTLIVIADEETQAAASDAAAFAAQEHPMRILVVIPRPGRNAPRLDAEVRVGGDEGPGEVAKLRLRGQLAEHGGFVIIPLLLSDTPVVAWWPHLAPEVPASDLIGQHAQRRITTSPASSRQVAALTSCATGYTPGDTDLAWTQITSWRSLLAAALDQPHGSITGVEVTARSSHAASHLLASWLCCRLKAPTSMISSKNPGISGVRLLTTAGDIVLSRPDRGAATLTRPGLPPAKIALLRPNVGDLLAEELRRLDPDDVYGETLKSLHKVGSGRLDRAGKDS
ncbi:MAG: glucose-6-phosphate dehydrogenase assembly protein OpcA [Candidatus Nanopelagicales bacterium]|nr:glucose-6-phosphate dehydrogenase assembly protein OpcA [Candidatus Nanopelagicales bacterium]MDZ4250610.1 glucose-6-phosphate dehydrogenase assembly protein OpcA [Candidatus Nanopelagicales bacterium]